MIRIFILVMATSLAYSAALLYGKATASPVSTVVAVRLMENKVQVALGNDPSSDIVLDLLRDISRWVDDELRVARAALESQLDAEIQLADAVSSSDDTSQDQLVRLGLTARALADLNQCELELRAVAALASQLTIDVAPRTEEEKSENALLVEFETRCQSIRDIIDRLAVAEVIRVVDFYELAEEISKSQQSLRVAWGLETERRAEFSIEQAMKPESPGSDDYEAIGRRELQEWRSR